MKTAWKQSKRDSSTAQAGAFTGSERGRKSRPASVGMTVFALGAPVSHWARAIMDVRMRRDDSDGWGDVDG
jgi:hypothetical protein